MTVRKHSTPKPIEANRSNDTRATVRKTPTDQTAAGRNALKHGLNASRVVLADEDPQAFAELRQSLRRELAPATELERMLVNRIAAQHWRLNRIPALEAELFGRLLCGAVGEGSGPGGSWQRDGAAGGGVLAPLVRYESMLERSVARLLGELRKLQRERRGQERDASHRAEADRRTQQWRSPDLHGEAALAERPILLPDGTVLPRVSVRQQNEADFSAAGFAPVPTGKNTMPSLSGLTALSPEEFMALAPALERLRPQRADPPGEAPHPPQRVGRGRTPSR